jgi:hypothetical protein
MAQPAPIMEPAPGERLVRFVGDRVRFRCATAAGSKGWRALLRTNLGRAATLRREIIAAHAGGAVPAGASWRDLPMQKTGDGWQIELPLAEVGYFKAKAYLLDPKGWQHWPDGPDIGISVHPDFARTANTDLLRLHAAVWRDQKFVFRPRRQTRSPVPSTRRTRLRRHSALRQTARPRAATAAHRPHARLPHSAIAAGATHPDDLCALRPFWQSVCQPGFDRH